ncbi:MAG: DUF1598 domain-containing protein [Thermoguttaceae bacterium]
MKRTLLGNVCRLGLAIISLGLFLVGGSAMAQVVPGAVGGVFIDAEGVLSRIPASEVRDLSQKLTERLQTVTGDLNDETTLRKISLKKLNATIQECLDAKRELPDSVRLLGGLTSVDYVVAIPEENDVVIVGRAEGWKVGPEYSIVGKVSGRPVMCLEDLITLFRAMSKPRLEVISCSIDPTPEAIARVAQVRQRGFQRGEERALAAALENAYGRNFVSVSGVPHNSHLAKVLVAADYKMKEIGLEQCESPVRQIPSFVSLIRSRGDTLSPRFWFEADYATLAHDSTKNVWELGGVTVAVKTEDEIVSSSNGERRSAGRSSPAAVRWCDLMTTNFEKLAQADPVFGDMQNVMNLALAVALIKQEGLLEKTKCRVPTLTDDITLKLPEYPVPRYVDSRSTISRNAVVCGGVNINPFVTVDNAKLKTSLDKKTEDLTKPVGDSWFANVR